MERKMEEMNSKREPKFIKKIKQLFKKITVFALIFFWVFSGVLLGIKEAKAAPPTFVAVGAVSSSNSSITPSFPAGIATDDILLLFIETANEAILIANQNGGIWAEIANSPQGTGVADDAASTRLTVFWSRYNGTQTPPVTSDSGDHQIGGIIAVRGVIASGDPFDVTAGGVEVTADTDGAIPGATTSVADTLVVAAVATALPDANGAANFSAWANSDLTNVTEQFDVSRNSGNGGGIGIATGEKTIVGSYGDTAVTVDAAATKAMISIALKPTPNTSPSLSVSQPDGVGDTVSVGDSYNIIYTLSDPDDAVTSAFYYDTDAAGFDGMAITGSCATAVEGTNATCSWDTTGVAAGSYYIYGITNDGVNPQVSAYSPGQNTVNITIEQEILNKLDALEIKVDNLQAQTNQLPQGVWEYANRSLTDFGTLVADVWNSANRSLTTFGTLIADVWNYSGKSLDNFGNIVAGIWESPTSTMSVPGSIGNQLAENIDGKISNVASGVWGYNNRTLTALGFLAADVWNNTYSPDRRLTSREIGENEYIGGVSSSSTVEQVAEKSVTDATKYNIDLIRGATFDFAGIADGGSALTLVDAELDQPDDYWGNYELIVMSGANIGQKRAISGFDKNSNTITVASAFPSAISSSDKYVISHEGKLTNAIWTYTDRTLTGFGALVADVWSYPTRTITSIGSLASDIWNDTFAPTRRLTDKQLVSGGVLATESYLDIATSTLISEINENQTLIAALNNISADDVWIAATRTLTDYATSSIAEDVWKVASSTLASNLGTIGKQLVDNLDATISSRGISNLTAFDVWNVAERTLTSNVNFNDPDSATIASAVWANATRELTNYGNNITAADVWNVLSANLTTDGTIGKQLATNVDVAVSTRSTLAAADVWNYTNRTLTSFGTLVSDIWSSPTRTMTSIGSLASNIWNDTFAPERRLTDKQLASGGNLATESYLDIATSTLISEINENQTLIAALNNISADDVWNAASRTLTDYATSSIAEDVWKVASSTLASNLGAIGKHLVDNLDATISSRGISNLTAADVWTTATRTLTDYATSSMALAVWSEATRELTNYGNDITAADVWNVLSSGLTTDGAIGKQLALNVDTSISSRATVSDVWSNATRALTDYATSSIAEGVWSSPLRTLTSLANVAGDIWDYSTRSLTTFGVLASDIWNDTYTPIRKLTDYATSTLASAIWDEPSSIHLITGSTGAKLASSGTGGGAGGLTIETHTVSEFYRGKTGTATIQVKKNDVPVSGLTPTGVYYDPINGTVTWPGEGGSTVNFSEIGTTGVYYHDFNIPSNATEGVYKLAVSAAQTTVGSNFSDTFETETEGQPAINWSTISGNWVASSSPEVADGKFLEQSYKQSQWHTAVAGDVDWGDYTFTVNTTSTYGNYPGIKFRYNDTNNSYMCYLRIDADTVRLRKGNTTDLQTSSSTIALDVGVGYVIKAVVAGDNIKCYVNNQLMIDYTDPTPILTGKIGLMSYNTSAIFDNVSVEVAGSVSNSAFIAKDFAVVAPLGEAVWVNNDYATNTLASAVWSATSTGLIDYGTDTIGWQLAYNVAGSSTIATSTAAAVWDTATSTLTTADSVGKHLVDNLAASSTIAEAVWSYSTRVLTSFGSLASEIWDDIYAPTRALTSRLIGADDYIGGSSSTIALEAQLSSAHGAGSWAGLTESETANAVWVNNNVATGTIATGVWDAATSTFATAGSIGKAFADNREVKFFANGEIVSGSGADNYKAKLYIYDLSSQLVNAVTEPTITLYDSIGGVYPGTPTTMTYLSTGVYEFEDTVESANTGRWEAIVSIDTGGINPIIVSSYFEVEASPARVTINSITDRTVSDITANFSIANEGSSDYEYHYKYCVVATMENACDGVNEIAWGQSAEWIEDGVEEEFNKTLTVNNTGTYIYKVVVYWGTEKSVAALQFDAVSAETPPVTPSPGGGGGGGGTVTTPAVVYSSANFNQDGIVNSVDFSIMLYFWKTKSPFSNPYVDINKDGQVNSVDFSIMLYQWGKTGVNIAWYNYRRITNLIWV